MLHINDLTYRIEGKPILEEATAAIPEGHKVGLVGRNGAGKSTLLKLIAGDLHPDLGGITLPRGARIGRIAQEAPGGDDSLIDWVLSTDLERASLLAEAETATDDANRSNNRRNVANDLVGGAGDHVTAGGAGILDEGEDAKAFFFSELADPAEDQMRLHGRAAG